MARNSMSSTSTPSASASSSSSTGATLSKAPSSAAASSGLRKRPAASGSSGGRVAGRSVGGSSAGILRFYTDDAPGLKIGPTTVLVLSLMFIGFVVLLHIWGKFRS